MNLKQPFLIHSQYTNHPKSRETTSSNVYFSYICIQSEQGDHLVLRFYEAFGGQAKAKVTTTLPLTKYAK